MPVEPTLPILLSIVENSLNLSDPQLGFGDTSKLRHHSTNLQSPNIIVSLLHVDSIYEVAFESGGGLGMRVLERAVCVIAEDVFVVELVAGRIVEASDVISNRRLKQNKLVLIYFSNGSNQLFVERKQVLVVVDSWSQHVEDIFPSVCP